ncbi:MAG: C40 family peptidase [Vicinamibacterales bacterium]
MLGAIALALFSSSCASTGGTPRPFPTPGGAPSTPARSTGRSPGSRIVETALTFRGVPYRNGGSTPSGFDCSGFTQFVFAQHGLTLPREVRDQFRIGRSVKRGKQVPGDLIFFSTVAPGASHVGIALGDDAFVHAPSSRGVVRIERVTSSYWSRRLVGIRRLR